MWEAEPCGHSHQVGERLSFHFSHDLPAVRLYRDFADAQFSTDLLVQQARNHQRHYLTFSTTQ